MKNMNYRVMSALLSVEKAYRPSDMRHHTGQVLYWLKSQKNKEGAMLLFEAMCKNSPETIAGQGWLHQIGKHIDDAEQAQPEMIQRTASNEKSGLDLQQERLAKIRKENPRDANMAAETDASVNEEPSHTVNGKPVRRRKVFKGEEAPAE